MAPLERLTGRRSVRTGLIVLCATTRLALSTFAGRAGPLVLAATAVGAAGPGPSLPTTTTPAIRPFRVNIPETELVDLRHRIAATLWPTKELV